MKPIFSLFLVLSVCGLGGVEAFAADEPVVATPQTAAEGALLLPQAGQAADGQPILLQDAQAAEQPKAEAAPAQPAQEAAAAQTPQPQAAPEQAADLAQDLADATAPQEPKEEFVAVRETVQQEQPAPAKKEPRVVYNPKKNRDPMLSPDDFLLLRYREQQRLAAIEAERQRKLAEERRRQEEAERLRQLELARIKDPTREVRNKIHIGGIIGKEVFIGSKIYTIGNSIYGARIVSVSPDEVVFSYKGHKFVRKVKL